VDILLPDNPGIASALSLNDASLIWKSDEAAGDTHRREFADSPRTTDRTFASGWQYNTHQQRRCRDRVARFCSKAGHSRGDEEIEEDSNVDSRFNLSRNLVRSEVRLS
jgi:hypothetical protein